MGKEHRNRLSKRAIHAFVRDAAPVDRGIAQSEYFSLRRNGWDPIEKHEGRALLKEFGRKANVHRIKCDGKVYLAKSVPIFP